MARIVSSRADVPGDETPGPADVAFSRDARFAVFAGAVAGQPHLDTDTHRKHLACRLSFGA